MGSVKIVCSLFGNGCDKILIKINTSIMLLLSVSNHYLFIDNEDDNDIIAHTHSSVCLCLSSSFFKVR